MHEKEILRKWDFSFAAKKLSIIKYDPLSRTHILCTITFVAMDLKGCVCHICTSLFCMPKREDFFYFTSKALFVLEIIKF